VVTFSGFVSVGDLDAEFFNNKIKLNKMNESNNNHETANGTKPVLSAAAIWWKRLSPLKKELFESKYGIIDNQKINEIYKIHTDWSSEDLEQVSSCR